MINNSAAECLILNFVYRVLYEYVTADTGYQQRSRVKGSRVKGQESRG